MNSNRFVVNANEFGGEHRFCAQNPHSTATLARVHSKVVIL